MARSEAVEVEVAGRTVRITSPDKACKWCDYASSCGRRADVIAERAQRLAEEETPEVEQVYLPDKGEA